MTVMPPRRQMDPVDEVIAGIGKKRFGHRRMAEVYDRIDLHLSPGIPEQFVILIGPGGIGKTTLLKTILNDRIESVTESHRGILIPAAMVRADSAQGEDFPYVNLYEDFLNALDERGVKSTGEFVYQSILGTIVSTFQPTALRIGKVAMRFKNRLRAAVKARGTEVLIIDEASHLITAAKGDAQVAGDELKTLLEEIDESRLLLGGSYELFQIKLVSSQTLRRSKVVFFLPYDIALEDDRDEFRLIVRTLLADLPFEHGIIFTDALADEVMRLTYGITGYWVRAVVGASAEHLKLRKAYTQQLLFSYLPDAIERKVIEREVDIIKLLERGDLDGAVALGFSDFYRGSAGKSTYNGPERKSRTRIGQRKLGRDRRET